MIVLETKPYCDNCEYFEAEVSTSTLMANDSIMPIAIDKRIRCAYANICDRLVSYLKEQKEGDEE